MFRRRKPGPIRYVRVPIERMEDYRVVLAAATALAAHPDDPKWLDRLRWALNDLPDRDYYRDWADRMEPQPEEMS